MPNLEQYDAVDITSRVIAVRNQLGVPDSVRIDGRQYAVHHPQQVVVFAKSDDLAGFIVDKWIEAARDSSGGHILPTGGTYEPVYAEAARRSAQLASHLRHRNISNLDEVWPIEPGGPNSGLTYVVYRRERVVKPLGLDEKQCIIPDGTTANPQEEVVVFENKLAGKQWDFAMMGIGPDEKVVAGRVIPSSPHIGFIPPGTSPEQTAMLVELDAGTIFANSLGAPDPEHFFTHAITQGPADIRRANRHLLAATGPYKPCNMAKILFEPVTTAVPASQVLLFPQTTIVMDRQAAQLIQQQIARLPQRQLFPVTP